MNEEGCAGKDYLAGEKQAQGNEKELSHIAGFSVPISYDFTLLFLLFLIDKIFERVEFFGPYLPVLFYPVRYFIQLFEPGFTEPFPALLPDVNQSTFAENFKMLVDSSTGNIKIFGNSINVQRLFRDHADDLAPRRICNGLKYISSHKYKDMKPFGCGDNTTIHGVVCDN